MALIEYDDKEFRRESMSWHDALYQQQSPEYGRRVGLLPVVMSIYRQIGRRVSEDNKTMSSPRVRNRNSGGVLYSMHDL